MSRKPFQLREIKPREISPSDTEMLAPTVDPGVARGQAVVLEIDLGRISPDFDQPRRVLPADLHRALVQEEITCREAIEELLHRARSDGLARLILEGSGETSGLLDLAESIDEVGLRQPINVYEIADLDHPTGVSYRIGEGERRYWAHWLLLLGGREEFKSIRCVVERTIPDATRVRIRQLAENAVRRDLPAVARARVLLGLKISLARGVGIAIAPDADLEELGEAITRARYGGLDTRVSEPAVPDSHELDRMVGETLGRVTGKPLAEAMVRNYLALLRLPPEVQELAEQANLGEGVLRPVTGLDDPEQRFDIVGRIVEEGLSGRQVQALVKEAKAGSQLAKEVVKEARPKGLTPQSLRRRVRSMATFFEKRMEEMGGISSLRAELSKAEEYGEAINEMLRLRDLLSQMLEGSGDLKHVAEAGESSEQDREC